MWVDFIGVPINALPKSVCYAVVLPPHDAERISPSRRGASPSRPHNALRPERRLVCVEEDARTEVGPRR